MRLHMQGHHVASDPQFADPRAERLRLAELEALFGTGRVPSDADHLPRRGRVSPDHVEGDDPRQRSLPVWVWGDPSAANRLVVVQAEPPSPDDGTTQTVDDAQFAHGLAASLGAERSTAVYCTPANSRDPLTPDPAAAMTRHAAALARVMVDRDADRVFLVSGVMPPSDAVYVEAFSARAAQLDVPMHVLPLLMSTPQDAAQAVRATLAAGSAVGSSEVRSRQGSPGAPGTIPWDASGDRVPRGRSHPRA